MMEGINWQPTIGDPSVIGWVTVIIYFFVAVLSLRVALMGEFIFRDQIKRQSIFWMLMAFAFVFLGINKQLDLQSLLTEVGRLISREQGWYENRKQVQKLFILSIAGFATLLVFSLIIIYRKVLRENMIAIIGISILLAFIGIRASSFHHMDTFINYRLHGMRMNWVMEIGAMILVAINAIYLLKKTDFSHAQPTIRRRTQTGRG